MTSFNQREMSNIVSESNLISLVNKDQMKHINNKIKNDCAKKTMISEVSKLSYLKN
jgi:hypothetical protein